MKSDENDEDSGRPLCAEEATPLDDSGLLECRRATRIATATVDSKERHSNYRSVDTVIPVTATDAGTC